jgi:PiT family inorganic phosphate transporter
MTVAWLLLAVGLVAYSNGANDNFKGVASLFGSRTTSYRSAIGWATATTFAGSLAAIALAQSLLNAFSGKGLVPDAALASELFLAVAVGGAVYLLFRWLRIRIGVEKEWRICVGSEQRVVSIAQPASLLAVASAPPAIAISVGEVSQCAQRYAGTFWGIGSQRLMDVAHFASAGIVSFARGLNDTPKIAALLLILPWLHSRWRLVAVAVVMAVGGLLSGFREPANRAQRRNG